MALFSSFISCVGIDLGTSSLKLVELVNRKKRIEVATYGQAEMSNLLVHPAYTEQDAVQKTAQVIKRMMEQAGTSADLIVAALPSTAVFSTVISLPQIPDKEMEKAVQFAARDVVPADLDEMVLGWGRAEQYPHMTTDALANSEGQPASEAKPMNVTIRAQEPIPVFITAAPKHIVNRYISVIKELDLHLLALEVETFSLARSLLGESQQTALLADMGDRATTFHIIDHGTPRATYAIDYGGHDLTAAIAEAGSLAPAEAEKAKAAHGLKETASANQRLAVEMAVKKQVDHALKMLRLYEQKEGRPPVKHSVLIGGGANLPGLAEYWSRLTGHQTRIGNPWKGLSYPQALEAKLQTLGPTYGVAVGLALRGVVGRT